MARKTLPNLCNIKNVLRNEFFFLLKKASSRLESRARSRVIWAASIGISANLIRIELFQKVTNKIDLKSATKMFLDNFI